MSVEFKDYSIQVKEALNDSTISALYAAAGELESMVKQNQKRVATGQTKNAWTHQVDESKGEAVVGNPLENAIWEEFGTGDYAVNGDGRKGGWAYKDEKGDWHKTKGKTPLRPLQRAFVEGKNTIIKIFEKTIQSGMIGNKSYGITTKKSQSIIKEIKKAYKTGESIADGSYFKSKMPKTPEIKAPKIKAPEIKIPKGFK